jgi:tetratricopeptide (TPR) repeat protein
LLGLGYRLTNEVLGHAQARAPTIARCTGLADAGQLAFFLGRYADAQASLQESLAIAREFNDDARIEAVLQPLGMACLAQGNVAQAREHLEEALGMARDLGNARELAGALNALGQLHRMDRDLDRAVALYEEALALARRIDDREIVAVELLNLAMTLITRGALTRGRDLLLEVLAIARSIGSKPAVQSVLEASAGLAASRADWWHAALFFGAAETLVAQTGLHRDPVDEAFLSPHVRQAREMLGADGFAGAKEEGLASDYDAALGRVMAWLQRATD